MKYYAILKDMPFHKKGDLLISNGTWYIWENGTQYALPVEIVESNNEWFEEAFPTWVQNEPCWYLSLNGMVISDYFDRTKHSSLARFGNLFKSQADAEMTQVKIQSYLQAFVDGSISNE